MIKKFITNLLAKATGSAPGAGKPSLGKRVDVPVQTHGIDPTLVDDRAVNVVRTLQDAGFVAYIVGGAVRDLLLGLRPKDFDVATDATPEQVKSLFRRAFIIGRRFRIVHVVYGRGREHEVIEVSTFRAYLDNAAAEQVAGNEKTSKSELAGMKHAVDSTGRVLRDNVWGPQEEDAVRRDFTINAMYYDPQTQILVDYHGGIKDAKNKTLKMIGDAGVRYLLLHHIVPTLPPLPGLEGYFLGEAPRVFGGPVRVARDGDFLSLPTGSQEVKASRRF
jgi:poly(A) polymerase